MHYVWIMSSKRILIKGYVRTEETQWRKKTVTEQTPLRGGRSFS